MGFVQQHKARLAAEISSLRKQAEIYNNPATYVKCAKFQRLANAKEKELAGLHEHSDNSVQDRVDSALYTAKVGAGNYSTLISMKMVWKLSHNSDARVCCGAILHDVD